MAAPARPSTKMIAAFKPEMAGADTVGDYLAKDWSLIICCKRCPRLAEWTPDDLSERFGGKPRTKIADIAARLKCSDPACKSEEVAVFPYPYDAQAERGAP